MKLASRVGSFCIGGCLAYGALAPLMEPAQALSPQPATECDRAVVIDGLLVCGDDERATLADVCGRPAWSNHRLAAGDRVEPEICSVASPQRGQGAWGRMRSEELAALEIPIDLNGSSAADLQSLRGVGPALGARIVDARPFASPDDLARVRGIGPKTLARARGRLALVPPYR